MTLIQNRRSKTSGSAPSSVADGELVINQADGLLYYADAGGTVRSTPLQGNAPLASPAFTGSPTAPTPASGDSSQKLATTGFVKANFAAAAPAMNGTAAAGSATTAARSDHVHPTDTSRAKAGSNSDITSLNATLTNTVFCNGTSGLGQFVSISPNGNYGAGLRNDGGNVYLMQTASGSPTGGWNAFRPFLWSLANGAVTIDGTGAGVVFGSRPSWLGFTPYDNGNLTSGQIGSILGYTPARPVTAFAGSSGGTSGNIAIGNTSPILAVSFTATATTALIVATCSVICTAAGVGANLSLTLTDTTAGTAAIGGPNTPFTAGAAGGNGDPVTMTFAFGSLTLGHTYQVFIIAGQTSGSGNTQISSPSISGVVV